MVQILIHKSGRGSRLDASDWQPFDVVAIRPDSHVWGTNEEGPNTSFHVIRLPGVRLSRVQHLLESETVFSPEPVTTKRRKYGFNLKALPVNLKASVTGRTDGTAQIIGRETTLSTKADQDSFIAASRVKP